MLLSTLFAALALVPALSVRAQSIGGGGGFIQNPGSGFILNPGGSQFVRPGGFVTADPTRRNDPIVFFDRVSSTATTDTVFHVSVYASGLVVVSRASFANVSVEDVDFDFVGTDTVAALRQALNAAGASRLNGLLPGSSAVTTASQIATVTFFQPNFTLRARPFTANSFTFGADPLDPRAARIEAILEDFVDDNF
jgi:hypothetical protein